MCAARNQRLTKKKEDLRLSGLRILARLIARAHMASIAEEDSAPDGGAVVGREPLGGDGEHGR